MSNKNNLKNDLTKALIKRFFPYLQIYINAFWKKFDNNIPKFVLNSKHISHTKLVENREKLLQLLPKNGVVAEIGVARGDFSKNILKTTNPQKLYLIDNWNTRRYHHGLYYSLKKRFKNEIKSGKVEIIVGSSTEVTNNFRDNHFDWIYLDSNHSYKTTRTELQKYKNKIKKNGLIAGHDYIVGNWNSMLKYGVIQAVNEFCVRNNWEVVYLTTNFWESPSFAIRRL